MSYTIETLARLASLNEASARERLRQLGISPNIMDRYSERDLERVKGFADARAAAVVNTRFIPVGAAATRLGIRPDEVHRLIGAGELHGGEWDGGRRSFLTVSVPSIETYGLKRDREALEAAEEAPQEAPIPAPVLAATPAPVMEEPDRPFLWQVCDKVKARIARRKGAEGAANA